MKNYVIAFALLIIAVLGAYLRFQSIAETVVDTPIRADAREYMHYAYNMKYNHIYSRENVASEQLHPDAARPPGYPIFLSFFLDREVSPLSLKNILFSQVILSTLTILLAYFLFREFLNSSFVSLGVAALVALSPHLITMNVYFLSETLFCFLLLASISLISRPQFQASAIMVTCFGVVLAMANLTRPWLNYFIIFLVIFLLSIDMPHKKKIIIYGSIGFFSVMSLWFIRNLTALGVASDNTLTIATLHHGSYPYFMYNYQPESYGFPYRFDPNTSKITASIHSVLSEIVRHFVESPLEYSAWYLLGKPYELFAWSNDAQAWGDVFIYPVNKSPYFDHAIFQLTHHLMEVLYPWVVGLFVLSLVLVWLPREKLKIGANALFMGRFIALLFFYFLVVHCLGAPFPRYAIPMQPLMYGMAMFAVVTLVKWGGDYLRRRLAA